MGDTGKLAYKANGADAGKLAYKAAGSSVGQLVYKVMAGQTTQITFAWGSDGYDLDICAYWEGDPDMKVGFGYDTSTAEHIRGVFKIQYSGDVIAADDAEWVKVSKTVWSDGSRNFRVYLNFFGHYTGQYDLDKCTVIAAQMGGRTLIRRNVPCGIVDDSKAVPGRDPGVMITFDAEGNLDAIDLIPGGS